MFASLAISRSLSLSSQAQAAAAIKWVISSTLTNWSTKMTNLNGAIDNFIQQLNQCAIWEPGSDWVRFLTWKWVVLGKTWFCQILTPSQLDGPRRPLKYVGWDRSCSWCWQESGGGWGWLDWSDFDPIWDGHFKSMLAGIWQWLEEVRWALELPRLLQLPASRYFQN